MLHFTLSVYLKKVSECYFSQKNRGASPPHPHQRLRPWTPPGGCTRHPRPLPQLACCADVVHVTARFAPLTETRQPGLEEILDFRRKFLESISNFILSYHFTLIISTF